MNTYTNITTILDNHFKPRNYRRYVGFPVNPRIPKIHTYRLYYNNIYDNYISDGYYYYSFKNTNNQQYMIGIADEWFNIHKMNDIDIICRYDNIIKSAQPIAIDYEKKFIKLKLN